MNRRTLSLISIIVLSVFVLAACGGGDDATSSPEPTTIPTEIPTDVPPTEEATEEPVSMPETEPETVVEEIETQGDFTILVAAIEATDLSETLSGRIPHTLFAPTDAAFEAFLTEQGMTQEELLADVDALQELLLYHVVYDGLDAVLLNREKSLTALDGNTIMLATTDEGEFILNDAVHITLMNVYVSNGLIHVIDAVLVVPEPEETTMPDIEETEVAAPEEIAAPEPTEQAEATPETEN
jgi:transforming growth factor-beta-induced protein